MYVTEFELESFFGGPSLRFLDLGNGLNVAFTVSDGAAGQLLQAIPGTLFGDARFFSRASSDRLAQARRTAVMVRTEDGAFRVERSWQPPALQPVVVTGDGQPVDMHRWDAQRARVSAAEYADVFTFDVLRLRHRLRTRRHAIRELRSLARELDADSAPRAGRTLRTNPDNANTHRALHSAAAKLAALQTTVDQTVRDALQTNHQPAELASPEQWAEEIRRTEQSLREAREQLSQREMEWDQIQAAQACLPLRAQLADLADELTIAPRSSVIEVTRAATDSLEQVHQRLLALESQAKALRTEYATLSAQRRELNRFSKQDQCLPQIEAVLWQEKPLIKEEVALRQLKERIRELEQQIERDRLEEKTRPTPLSPAATDVNVLGRLDLLSDRMRDAERDRTVAEESLGKAEASFTANRFAADSTAESVDAVAVHQAETRVARLREQLSWRESRQQLLHDRGQLERQVRSLYRDQLLPFATVLVFGVPFALGAAMIIHALLSRTNAVNWQQVLWGFLIAFVTIVIKVLRDRERAQLLTAVRRKLARVDDRLAQLGGDSPVEEGALAAELREAEQELRDLSESRPAVSAASTLVASGSVENARRRANEASARLRDLAQQWRELMIDLDLSPSLTPARAREALAERALRESEAARTTTDSGREWQLQGLREEWDRRQQTFLHQLTPFRHFAKELGRAARDDSVSALSEILHEAVREATERKGKRRQCQREYRRLRQREADLKSDRQGLLEQRKRLREEFRQRQAKAQSREKRLADQRQKQATARTRLQQQLDAALQRHALDPHGQLCSLSETELAAQAQAKQQEITALREHVVKLAERRGMLRGQLDPQQSPPSPPAVEAFRPILDEIQQLHQHFQSLASQPQGNSASLDRPARESQYLQTAARYLRRLSGGQYPGLALAGAPRQLHCRSRQGTWVPLAEVREAHFANIYFALWLARLEQYADRGLRFPVILQDPLIVTPPRHKARVAETLREIAGKGHQMLLVSRSRRNVAVWGRLGVPIADLSQRDAAMNGKQDGWTPPPSDTPPREDPASTTSEMLGGIVP